MNVLVVVVVYITTTKANTNATNNYPIHPRQVAGETKQDDKKHNNNNNFEGTNERSTRRKILQAEFE